VTGPSLPDATTITRSGFKLQAGRSFSLGEVDLLMEWQVFG